jgi:ribosome biogenesis GTPase
MLDLTQYGYIETEVPPQGVMPGRVIEHQKEQYNVITNIGEVHATLKGSYYYDAKSREDYPCVGDFVFLQHNNNGPSLITRLLPRRSKFSRGDQSGHADGYAKTLLEQVIAANVDYVFIMTSMNFDLKVNRIERYVTQTMQSGSRPIVLLTKADLAGDPDKITEEVRTALPNIPVHAISNLTGAGIDALNDYLSPGITVVFLGMSGVGKSSLLNALMKKEVMTVKEIRDDDSRGRHTTTHRQLFTLPCGAMVIDTPGMRELGIFDASTGFGAAFSDIEKLASNCRFTNCRHDMEPGCAIHEALNNGSLSRSHWDNFINQRRELKYADDRSAYLREKNTRGKNLSKWSKTQKKDGKIKF